MTPVDWLIVFGGVTVLTWFSLRSAKYMQGVADFLAANRSAGRYMLTMAASATGLGAISAVGMFEQYYAAGMPTIWWSWMTIPAGIIIALTGWVTYRFRETRCLTLAQFFEVRYSRRFRVFAAAIVWLSGILNFGIFPFVASNFFVYYCNLPDIISLGTFELPTYWPIMLLTTGLALLYTMIGGHITVMVTDCVQGIFVSAGLLLLCVFLLSNFAWTDIVESMNEAPVIAAREELQRDVQVKQLALDAAIEQGNAAAIAEHRQAYDALIARADDADHLSAQAQGKSMLNPFDVGRVSDFGFAFFLIVVFNQFYGLMSWQGSQAYQSAGISPHEQKMSAIIFPWIYAVRLVGLVLLSICALTFLNHPNYAAEAAEARQMLEQLGTSDVPQLAVQQRVPIALSHMLPAGLRGLFCIMMVFLLITTQDTYMHSWGTIFVQDVWMPIRGKPMSPRGHVNALRWSIGGVAVFAILFACLYEPNEYIQMYFAITGAVISGLGCVIIGGLYWKHGSTLAAYVAVTLGAVLSIARIVCMHVGESIAAIPDKNVFIRFLHYTNTEMNSQIIWFYIMIVCIVSYLVLSFITRGEPFNIDRMLHRGAYDVEGDHKTAKDAAQSRWMRWMGITKEFSRTDRFLALGLVLWNGVWVAVFFGAIGFHFLIQPITDSWWSGFWKVWIYVQIAVGIPASVWFTVGSVGDLRAVFHRLSTLQRDDADDGRVVDHHLPGDKEEPTDADLPSIVCKKISSRIEVDGDISKPVWSQAHWVELPRHGDCGAPRQATKVGVLWDDQYLYVGFDLEDDQPAGVMTRHDDPLWEDGNVAELFVDPSGDGKSYYEFQINPLNTLMDLFFEEVGQPWPDAKQWDAQDIRTAVAIDQDQSGKPRRWTVEMAVSLADFQATSTSPPSPGQTWRVNFGRYDTRTQDGNTTLELSSWSPTFARGFGVPSRFGVLKFEA